MEWLQTVCNIIIIVGGACMAIKNVSEWLGKPIHLFKKKGDNQFENKVAAVLEKKLPEILNKHCAQTCKNCGLVRQEELNNVKQAVLGDLADELKHISLLTIQYEALVISAKDVLREKIMQIYNRNLKDRTLSFQESRILKQLYKDYKAIKGNSYIDDYYERMMTWSILDDDYNV